MVFFEIKGSCIETFGRLACSIDISNLEKFNEHIALTNIKPLNDGCIVNCFDEIERIKVKDKITLRDALKKCPDKSM